MSAARHFLDGTKEKAPLTRWSALSETQEAKLVERISGHSFQGWPIPTPRGLHPLLPHLRYIWNTSLSREVSYTRMKVSVV